MKTEENAITSPSLYLAVNLSFIPTPTYLPGNKVQIRLKNARHFKITRYLETNTFHTFKAKNVILNFTCAAKSNAYLCLGYYYVRKR